MRRPMANLLWLIGAILAPLLWLVPRLGTGSHLSHPTVSVLSGVAIVGAAFMLSWATELAERYVPPAFALIVLALISVLPEYAVDMTFAFKAGSDPAYRAYAVANMTGANRILIGVGWSMLVFIQWARVRKPDISVDPSQRLELGFLLLATVYALVLPLKASISLTDSVVFIGIFIFYVFRALQTEGEEGELVGPARWISERVSDPVRIATIAGFLVYACAAIWFSAEPFAEGLVQTGKVWGIDEFLLVQLVAPLASESPEFIVAILFVMRNRPSTALGALVSSKVNQWTLLVAGIPMAYAAGSAERHWGELFRTGMHLEARPREEILLTAAQSLFAVAVLADLRFGLREAMALFVLFAIPWLPWFNEAGMHYVFSALYFLLVLGIGLGSKTSRENLARLLKLRG
jgi:cation:H+ antiporter